MDQPTGNPKTVFDAIVAHVELCKEMREYDDADHSAGQNVPTTGQVSDAVAILKKARELRRILGRINNRSAF